MACGCIPLSYLLAFALVCHHTVGIVLGAIHLIVAGPLIVLLVAIGHTGDCLLKSLLVLLFRYS